MRDWILAVVWRDGGLMTWLFHATEEQIRELNAGFEEAAENYLMAHWVIEEAGAPMSFRALRSDVETTGIKVSGRRKDWTPE